MPGFELIGEEEYAEISQVFRSGGILSRFGLNDRRSGCFKVEEFEAAFADNMKSNYALAVTSGTAALRVALAVIDLKPGDVVLIPSFTFVATAEAVIEAGASPRAVEINETLNMDPDDLESKIDEQVKAVIVVHMLGVPAELDAIKLVCDNHGLPLIEDTAWGCGGTFQGQKLGTVGRMGTFSFDIAKTITTGEGGMILFNDEQDFLRAKAWHDHGHENNPAVPRWEDTRKSSGFNFRMTELQGAVGVAQLRKLNSIIERQTEIYGKLSQAIREIPGVRLRSIPLHSQPTHDAVIFFVEESSSASKCRESLLKRGISTKILPEAISWHFFGLWGHMADIRTSYGPDISSSFPVSTKLLSQSVALPVMLEKSATLLKDVRSAILEATT